MLDENELATYAAGAAAALRIMGPMPRDEVLQMLRGLHLADAEAAVVLSYGIAQGVLAEEAPGCVVAGRPKR